MTPTEIFAVLSQDVIGQDQALQEMAVAFYKHLIEHSVGNVLLIGNSGTGKTTIMNAAEQFFTRAEGFERFSTIIRINANLVADLASRGVQSNVVMDRLARQAAKKLGEHATLDTMLDYVSHGIVCVDEIDKLRASVGGQPNVKGIVAQDSLLTLMENENVQVEIPYFEAGSWHSQTMTVNTRHILFVGGGAFEELYDQVFERVTKRSGVDKLYRLIPRADGSLERRFVFEISQHLTLEDIFNYGMTPQFLSRFASIVMLRDFTASHLLRIFQDIPGAIWPIAVNYFKHMGITLAITEEAAFLIADKAAHENRLGARALSEVFGRVVKRLEFDPLGSGLIQDINGQQVLEINRDLVETAFPE